MRARKLRQFAVRGGDAAASQQRARPLPANARRVRLQLRRMVQDRSGFRIALPLIEPPAQVVEDLEIVLLTATLLLQLGKRQARKTPLLKSRVMDNAPEAKREDANRE